MRAQEMKSAGLETTISIFLISRIRNAWTRTLRRLETANQNPSTFANPSARYETSNTSRWLIDSIFQISLVANRRTPRRILVRELKTAGDSLSGHPVDLQYARTLARICSSRTRTLKFPSNYKRGRDKDRLISRDTRNASAQKFSLAQIFEFSA